MHATQQTKDPLYDGVLIDVDGFKDVMREHGATSIQQMARLLDTGDSTISRLLNRRQPVSGKMLHQFARFGPDAVIKMCDFGEKGAAA